MSNNYNLDSMENDDNGEPDPPPDPYNIQVALDEVKAVLDFGAKKYPDPNNKRDGSPYGYRFDKSTRHGECWWHDGDDADEETGLHPLAHRIAQDLLLLSQIKRGVGVDDRSNKGE